MFKIDIQIAKRELCSARTWTQPRESTHRELSFEWSRWIVQDLEVFLVWSNSVAFGSERINLKLSFICRERNLRWPITRDPKECIHWTTSGFRQTLWKRQPFWRQSLRPNSHRTVCPMMPFPLTIWVWRLTSSSGILRSFNNIISCYLWQVVTLRRILIAPDKKKSKFQLCVFSFNTAAANAIYPYVSHWVSLPRVWE